jgi:hypothetical protein
MMRKQSSWIGFVAFTVAVYSLLFTLMQPPASLHRRTRPPVSREWPAPEEKVDEPERPSSPARFRNLHEWQYASRIAVREQIG